MLDLFTNLVVGFLSRLINDVQNSVSAWIERYLLTTSDVSTLSPRPLTSDPALQAMFHVTLTIADALLVLVFTYAFLRSQWERGIRAHYTLKATLLPAMASIALAHFALVFGQMAIDLNNAMVHAVWTAPQALGSASFPWTFAMTRSFGMPLFELGVRVVIAVLLVILAFTYVLRFALLSLLLAIAPLAALCMILPETKAYARAWSRVFLLTVFMQFAQVLVLRLASMFTTELNGNPIEAIYGCAVLYLMVKVPGLMNASAHLEGKAGHLAGSVWKKAYKAANPTTRASAAASSA
jgi:hypothetical protein